MNEHLIRDIIAVVQGQARFSKIILIDPLERSVRKVTVERSRIKQIIGTGARRQTQLENGDVIIYQLYNHDERESGFFAIEKVSEPYTGRAAIVANVGDVVTSLTEVKRVVKFINEATARDMADKAIERAERITAELTGKPVKRWRPWEQHDEKEVK
jgi:hypothetical protein